MPYQDGWALIQRADLTTVWAPREYVEVIMIYHYYYSYYSIFYC